MEQLWQRFVEGFMARLEGPMNFRFILQPLVAIIFAAIDGIKDAKTGKPPYFWGLIFDPHRMDHLKSGWKSVGKIFIIAIILDIAYQLKVFHEVRLHGVLIAGIILAILPYLLLRGPVNRLARLFVKK